MGVNFRLRAMVGIAAAVSLAGCATPYQDANWLTGGVEATRIDETTLQVVARGNAYTSQTTVYRYLLRKAAEETLAAGYGHFQIVTTADETRRGTVTTPGSSMTTTTATAQGMGNMAFGTAMSQTQYMPSQSYSYSKPGTSAIIKMYLGPKPTGAPGNVYDAAEVVKFLTPEAPAE